jgi:hexosaminidase
MKRSCHLQLVPKVIPGLSLNKLCIEKESALEYIQNVVKPVSKQGTMKKSICLWTGFLLFLCVNAQQLSVIPQPKQVAIHSGSFPLHEARVILPADQRAKAVASFFSAAVKEQTGLDLSANKSSTKIIRFSFSKDIIDEEGYAVTVTPSAISVIANNDRGLFWAVQTLRQMLPLTPLTTVDIPAMQIKDAPAYSWRSSMMDVSRHFFSIDFLKKHIDMLSLYKINTFHWHLTDDQGWRIEIKKYPALTTKGAWRKELDGSTHGGYYTQAEVKDLVEYARQRHVTVIPEIEMPGHSMAAIVAYPELSCRKLQLEVPAYFGVLNDVLCAGQELSYQFCRDVLNEVMNLFPSKYIHIGGDEVPKYRWQNCTACQQKMKSAGLKDEHALQSYFIKRIQKHLQSKGRILVGWDEIMEGGADKNAVIEVWRGQEKAKEAIANGNKVIQTLYLDAPPGALTLSKSFQFDPSVANSGGKVLGADAPLWTEWVTEYNAWYMLYPRLQAFAERLWNTQTDYDDFRKRLRNHYARMNQAGTLYGTEDKNLLATQLRYIPAEKSWRLYAQAGPDDLELFYSLNDEPANKYSFTDSLSISSPEKIHLVPMRKGKQAMSAIHYSILSHNAVGKKVNFNVPYDEQYKKVGDYGLTDGITGGFSFGDGTWMGWFGKNMDIVIDMDSTTAFQYLQLNCLQHTQSWIMLPQKVEFFVSDDGRNWNQLTTVKHKIPADDFKPQSHAFIYQVPVPIKARYIRAVATNFGKLPEWHNGAGGDAWIFADELIIR